LDGSSAGASSEFTVQHTQAKSDAQSHSDVIHSSKYATPVSIQVRLETYCIKHIIV